MRWIYMIVIAMALVPGVSAYLQLDSIQFDPAIIASGDEVDIIVQFHEEGLSKNSEKINNPEWRFHVNLEPDDTLTEEYVLIADAKGDDMHRTIYSGGYYNKRFRVKVESDAPAGNYEFRLSGRWYKEGEPEEASQFLKFMMPVKKEGILLDVSNFQTVPSEVRPGDNYVKIVSRIENSGEKDAKAVEVKLELPEGLEASYSNDNRIWVGRVNAGESKEMVFYADVDEYAEPGVYDIAYSFEYMDLDNNEHDDTTMLPFRVKPRPYLEIARYAGEGLAGDSGKLYVTVRNTGSESAESVDVRILKQSAQPFEFDVRSEYIGELEPGEEGVAIFDISINDDADVKEYDFKLLIRSKGDSDEGDDNIYTYTRRAKFDVTGQAPNRLRDYGLIAVGVIAVIIIISLIYRGVKR